MAAQQGWRCFICKELLEATYQIDHQIPLEFGGANMKDNYQALCCNCHSKKSYYETNPQAFEQFYGTSKYFGAGPLCKLINKHKHHQQKPYMLKCRKIAKHACKIK